MTEKRRPDAYYPGDEVRIRVSFTHAANFVEVEVVYAHAEHQSHTLTLSGNPDPDEGSPISGDNKRSTAAVSERVDVKHIPGLYRAVRAVFYLLSGAVFTIEASDTVPRPFGVFPHQGFQPPQILVDQWPEIQVRPETPYAEITTVDLERADD